MYNKRQIAKIDSFLNKFRATTIVVDKNDGRGMRFYHKSMLSLILNEADSLKYDMYFIPNTGGTKENQIVGFNAVFVDLDAGRDKNGKYFPKRRVDSLKRQMMEKIVEFEKKYRKKFSFVVETRNGYQCYLLVSNLVRSAQPLNLFKNVENGLLTFFGTFADWKVRKANQIMRLPYTYWNKKNEGYPAFLCSVVLSERTTTNYTLDHLEREFGKPSPPVQLVNTKKEWSNVGAKPVVSNEMIDLLELIRADYTTSGRNKLLLNNINYVLSKFRSKKS